MIRPKAFPQVFDFAQQYPPIDATPAEYIASLSGMDLRDYFAAAALSGAMANSRLDENLTIEMIVEDCWKAADAMMEARKK